MFAPRNTLRVYFEPEVIVEGRDVHVPNRGKEEVTNGQVILGLEPIVQGCFQSTNN